jgi:hypothetical protein
MGVEVASRPREGSILKQPLVSHCRIEDEAEWWRNEQSDPFVDFFVPLPCISVFGK